MVLIMILLVCLFFATVYCNANFPLDDVEVRVNSQKYNHFDHFWKSTGFWWENKYSIKFLCIYFIEGWFYFLNLLIYSVLLNCCLNSGFLYSLSYIRATQCNKELYLWFIYRERVFSFLNLSFLFIYFLVLQIQKKTQLISF